MAFLDALDIGSAILIGYDWGGRAACIVAALWPERCRGLVTVGGYNIQDPATANRPASAAHEYRAWYQWYFNTERGRAGLEQNRRDICRLLWQLWSPNWSFDDATFERTAASFDNPDFVDVVIHSYRHRRLNAPGDPALEQVEKRLAAQPTIAVPTVVLSADGVRSDDYNSSHFSGTYERRLLLWVGHFLPREAPEAIVAAVEAAAFAAVGDYHLQGDERHEPANEPGRSMKPRSLQACDQPSPQAARPDDIGPLPSPAPSGQSALATPTSETRCQPGVTIHPPSLNSPEHPPPRFVSRPRSVRRRHRPLRDRARAAPLPAAVVPPR